jgi:hypothetical protein
MKMIFFVILFLLSGQVLAQRSIDVQDSSNLATARGTYCLNAESFFSSKNRTESFFNPDIYDRVVVFQAKNEKTEQNAIYTYDLGEDRIPKTADDSGPYLLKLASKEVQFLAPQIWGPYITFVSFETRNLRPTWTLHLASLGVDGIPGNKDDIPPTQFFTYQGSFLAGAHIFNRQYSVIGPTLTWQILTSSGREVYSCRVNQNQCKPGKSKKITLKSGFISHKILPTQIGLLPELLVAQIDPKTQLSGLGLVTQSDPLQWFLLPTTKNLSYEDLWGPFLITGESYAHSPTQTQKNLLVDLYIHGTRHIHYRRPLNLFGQAQGVLHNMVDLSNKSGVHLETFAVWTTEASFGKERPIYIRSMNDVFSDFPTGETQIPLDEDQRFSFAPRVSGNIVVFDDSQKIHSAKSPGQIFFTRCFEN